MVRIAAGQETCRAATGYEIGSNEEAQMPRVKTTINGQEIEVERDRWALDVIREMGIEVPTLCHHPALAPYGACRLCVVEVTKRGSTWLATSCDLPIREGLSIRTDTEAVHRARRTALELLLAEAPEAEEIRRLARQMGLEHPRFAPRVEEGKCILCGLCVRVCRDLIGASAICFADRATDRQVTSPFDVNAEACVGCMACAAVCPTGAIEVVDDGYVRRIDPFSTELELLPCEVCGKPAVPAKLLPYLRAKVPDHVPVRALCPACRRAEAAAGLSVPSRTGGVSTAPTP